MSKYITLNEQIATYVCETLSRETPVQKALRQATQAMPQHQMQISSDQAATLSMLVKLTKAKNILEIGTFTGYSALSMALAIPPDGKIIACDTSKEWTDIAKRYWHEAGVENRIDLRLAPAKDTLSKLIEEGMSGTFDMAFIDADKQTYDSYYEQCLKLLHPGGLIVLDNMLWRGSVANPHDTDKQTIALRDLNAKIHADTRVDMCLLTVGDGMVLAHKR